MPTNIYVVAAGLTLLGLGLGSSEAGGREPVAGPSLQGTRWAVVVGVDTYQDGEIEALEGAVADANAIAEALQRYARFPRNQVIRLTSLTSIKPTRAEILDAFSELKVKVGPDDLLLFFFAGHGVEMDGQRYLLTYDASYATQGTLRSTAFPVSQLMQELQRIPARNRIVMVDACRDDPVNRTRPQPKEATAALEALFTLQPSTEEGVRANFLSSKRGQSAYEWREERRGFFSYFIEKGIAGEAAVRGRVTVTSLAGYLNEFVPRAVREQRGKEQTPFMDLEGGELVLAEGVAPGPGRVPEPTMRTVYGVVKDSNGTPIAGVTVRVAWDRGAPRAAGSSPGQEDAFTTSDDDGFFKAEVPREAVVTITTGGAGGFAVRSATSPPQDAGKKVSLFLARLPKVPAPGAAAGRELARVAYQSFIVEAWKEAEQAARSAIEKDGDSILAGAVLANCFAFYGVNDRDRAKLERAREWAQSVLDMDSRMALAHNAMGLYLYGIGDRSGAESAFRTAVALDPRLGVAGSNLGQIYLDSGRYADAERAYRQAIRARPDNAIPYNGLAQVLIKLRRPQEGVQAALDAISRYPLQDAYLGRFYQNLAAALRDRGNHSAAREAEIRATSLGAAASPY